MPKKHYYAVVKGRRAGIYTQWSGETGAEAQVKGYPGAVFKSFSTREEAEQYLRSGGKGKVTAPAQMLPEADQQQVYPVNAHRVLPVKTIYAGKQDEPVDYADELANGKTVIFTDGASTGNPGPGGYGAVLLHGNSRKEISGGFRCTTNNRMELTAVIAALQALQRGSSVIVYSDSRYVVDAVQKGWAKRWRSRGWMRTTDDRAENSDLWAVLLDLLDYHTIEFRWVRGHASSPENERCDRLAVQAAHAANLPADPGYTGRCK
jgi:ribonuclease HI